MISCQKCKCTWFEVVQLQQIPDDILSYNQKPVVAIEHIFARCGRCGDLQELALQETSGDKFTKASYSDCITDISKPVEKTDESKG